ncbi:hypothetical protein ADILRU_1287 [Leifsonia rubra CMS 76R]|nr:hypothetical protein ADILRU_1287 [Leifsonia rubra CMS 76R]
MVSVLNENNYGEYASGIRVERTLAHLESIPDPYQRISECETASDQARAIQGKIAAVRRKAVYDATLRPGSSGESVAAELGISPKAVSTAISKYRKTDLELFRAALALYSHDAIGDLGSAEIRAASTTRDVLFAARTVLRAHAERDLSMEDNSLFEFLESAAERARSLATVGHVEFPKSSWDRGLLGQMRPDPLQSPQKYRRLARIMNALPQVFVTIWDEDEDQEWFVSWLIRPAEPYSTVFDAGPHRDGWVTSEWLVWFLNDYQRSGYEVHQYVTSPPPFLNEPGESLSFVARFGCGGPGKKTLPDQLADFLINSWDATGHTPTEWAEPGLT